MSYIPVCSKGAVCVVSRRSASEGTNFHSASFQEREIQDATTEVAYFEAPPEDVPTYQLPEDDQKRAIGGVVFTHGRAGEAGLGNYMGSDFYRAFHKRKCYELSVSIASSSFANFDPILEMTKRIALFLECLVSANRTCEVLDESLTMLIVLKQRPYVFGRMAEHQYRIVHRRPSLLQMLRRIPLPRE